MTDVDPHEKQRIFTAIKVPEDLARSFLTLPGKGVQGRWNNWRDLHITLRFIGDVDPALVPDIQTTLNAVKRPPVNIEIDGLDYFDNRQAVLFADVKSTRKLETLVADITDRLTPLGLTFPPCPYRPHVTLARLKNTPKDKTGLYIKRHSDKIKGHFKAASFQLLKSGPPDQKGAVYTTLAEYSLAP